MGVITERHERGWLEIRLDRPDKRNAIDSAMVDELAEALADAARDPDARCLLLSGSGKVFCAGADLEAMRQAARGDEEHNRAEAERLGGIFDALAELPFPTIARVKGAALGGGGGLVACCDIPLCGESTRFGFTEVRLGIIPAVISPYVLRKIGAAHALRYFQTGEIFDGKRAAEIGLVSEVVADEVLEARSLEVIDQILSVAPGATRSAKRLVKLVDEGGASLRKDTAELLAEVRGSEEAKEGMAAFLDKRAPKWQGES